MSSRLTGDRSGRRALKPYDWELSNASRFELEGFEAKQGGSPVAIGPGQGGGLVVVQGVDEQVEQVIYVNMPDQEAKDEDCGAGTTGSGRGGGSAGSRRAGGGTGSRRARPSPVPRIPYHPEIEATPTEIIVVSNSPVRVASHTPLATVFLPATATARPTPRHSLPRSLEPEPEPEQSVPSTVGSPTPLGTASNVNTPQVESGEPSRCAQYFFKNDWVLRSYCSNIAAESRLCPPCPPLPLSSHQTRLGLDPFRFCSESRTAEEWRENRFRSSSSTCPPRISAQLSSRPPPASLLDLPGTGLASYHSKCAGPSREFGLERRCRCRCSYCCVGVGRPPPQPFGPTAAAGTSGIDVCAGQQCDLCDRQRWLCACTRSGGPVDQNSKPTADQISKPTADQNGKPTADQNGKPTADQNDKPADQNCKLAYQNDKPADQNGKPADQNDKPADQNGKPADQNDKPANQNGKPSANQNGKPTADQNDKSADQNDRSADQNDKSADQNDKPADQNDKSADQNDKSADQNGKPAANQNSKPTER